MLLWAGEGNQESKRFLALGVGFKGMIGVSKDMNFLGFPPPIFSRRVGLRALFVFFPSKVGLKSSRNVWERVPYCFPRAI